MDTSALQSRVRKHAHWIALGFGALAGLIQLYLLEKLHASTGVDLMLMRDPYEPQWFDRLYGQLDNVLLTVPPVYCAWAMSPQKWGYFRALGLSLLTLAAAQALVALKHPGHAIFFCVVAIAFHLVLALAFVWVFRFFKRRAQRLATERTNQPDGGPP